MTDLYIYYQARDSDAAAVQAGVGAMQARLAVPAQLKRRPETRDGLHTWMEVYPGAADGFAAELAAAVHDSGLAALTVGARHTEVFMDIPPCA